MTELFSAVAAPVSLIVALMIGGTIALIFTKQISKWLEAMKVVNAITTLRKEKDVLMMKQREDRKHILLLKKQIGNLEEENVLLKSTLRDRDEAIDRLLKSIKTRDEEISAVKKEIAELKANDEHFRNQLFKYLTVHAGIDPDELNWHTGITQKP